MKTSYKDELLQQLMQVLIQLQNHLIGCSHICRFALQLFYYDANSTCAQVVGADTCVTCCRSPQTGIYIHMLEVKSIISCQPKIF